MNVNITEFLKDLIYLTVTASEEDLQKLYDMNFTIEFAGKKCEIEYDAVSYNAIKDALLQIQKEL